MKNKIIFIDDVIEITRLSRPTINKYINAGTFPKPSRIGSRNAWYEHLIQQWMTKQMTTSLNDGGIVDYD